MKVNKIITEAGKVIILAAVGLMMNMSLVHQYKCLHPAKKEIDFSKYIEKQEPVMKINEIATAQQEPVSVDRAYMTYEPTPDDVEEEMYYDSLELLAICVEAEAGNQTMIGKRLVVDVILNRVDAEEWPNNITDVIKQPYQFSSFWDGGMDRVEAPSEETYEAVRMELKNRTNAEILFFTAGWYNGYGTKWKKVGDHYFSKK